MIGVSCKIKTRAHRGYFVKHTQNLCVCWETPWGLKKISKINKLSLDIYTFNNILNRYTIRIIYMITKKKLI